MLNDEVRDARLKLWAHALPEPYQTQFWNIVANGTVDPMEQRRTVDELDRALYEVLKQKYPNDPFVGRALRLKHPEWN